MKHQIVANTRKKNAVVKGGWANGAMLGRVVSEEGIFE